MDIVKKNIVSIVFGVISLALLTAPFWLLSPAQEAISKDLDSRIAAAKKMDSLYTKKRQLPIVEENSERKPLDQFPNAETIKAANDVQAQVQREASDLIKRATDLNRQPLLMKDSLPVPRNEAAFFFRDKYRALRIGNLIATEILHGGPPPTKADIDAEIRHVWETQYQPKIVTYADGKDNKAQVDAEFKKDQYKIPMRLFRQRATEIKIYVDPDSFRYHSALSSASGAAPDAQTIWYAQLGIWIQQDLANAIASANADAKNVSDAVVKHLVRVNFDENSPYVMNNTAVGSPGGASASPAEVGGPNQPLPKNPAISVTERVSNGMYDVVAFDVTLRVDATRVNTLLRALGENHFIYIREIKYSPVDVAQAMANQYFYGTGPVVELNLSCEMLFLRDWTLPLMPNDVKTRLGIADPSAASLN